MDRKDLFLVAIQEKRPNGGPLENEKNFPNFSFFFQVFRPPMVDPMKIFHSPFAKALF